MLEIIPPASWCAMMPKPFHEIWLSSIVGVVLVDIPILGNPFPRIRLWANWPWSLANISDPRFDIFLNSVVVNSWIAISLYCYTTASISRYGVSID